ncbi:saccharopine dehydrogenase family protein [Saccharopolyspora sp. MS10]|uniref:saccharopine dehydrogenase family protein n=1 Tax=Saccharopolyspora sp. MS10 TaxID=3385973 RepID=UPI0039A2739D
MRSPTGRVHWLGTGLSTGSGLGLVCAEAERTLLWGRTADKAARHLAALDLAGAADPRALAPGALEAELNPGDLVVSMLPATQHGGVLRTALEHGAHFACSSYLSPEIAEQAERARRAGSVVLTESGLDPGIDHLLGHDLVHRASREVGDRPVRARFTSYCGSNPAEPDEFRYRFSWAPRGVLTALLTPARYLDDGEERTAERPWEAVREVAVGAERFEAYPNRDSLPFIDTYRFPASWRLETFIRGTLRLAGWSAAWKPVFAELPEADEDRITELAGELAAAHPSTPADRNRVVLSVGLELDDENGPLWAGTEVLDVIGDDAESATPRLVSVGLACGVLDVLAGRTVPGLHQAAAEREAVRRWLDFLDGHGVRATFRGGAR